MTKNDKIVFGISLAMTFLIGYFVVIPLAVAIGVNTTAACAAFVGGAWLGDFLLFDKFKHMWN